MKTFLFLLLFEVAAGVPNIVGGKPIPVSAAPYQLELNWKQGNWGFKCGATIVGHTLALTAGHCVQGASHLRVRSGSTERRQGEMHNIKTVILHPQYYESNDTVPHNDIAILEVDTPFQFNENTQPIDITDAEPNGGEIAFLSGWGALSGDGSDLTQLYGEEIPIVDRGECNEDYDGVIEESMICAGVPEGGKDSCHGDSGGPLVIDGKLVGLVSWGFGCAKPGYPGVYTNVAYFKDWIDQQVDSFS